MSLVKVRATQALIRKTADVMEAIANGVGGATSGMSDTSITLKVKPGEKEEEVK